MVIGVAVANLTDAPPRWEVGLEAMRKQGLRFAVALLGFRLSFGDVSALGLPGAAVIASMVAVSLVGVLGLARVLRVPRRLGLLIAAGSSICGASAIAAMGEATEADENEVTYAIGLVTLFGSAAIVLLPLVGSGLGLDDTVFGVWSGLSVHDVGQVVATATTRGQGAAIEMAVLTKLMRVALLAPVVLATRLFLGRRARGRPPTAAGSAPLVPLFLLAFLAAVAVRSTSLVPTALLSGIRSVEGWLMAAALFSLGAGVQFRELRRLGGRGVLVAGLGFLSLTLLALFAAPLVVTS